MQSVLVMFRSDGDRRSFSLTRDITVIGRREDCDLRIPLGDISRKHCRLVRDGDVFRLEDLGSSNGTYHNGQRVQEASLSPGDSIQVGPVVFVLQIDGVPADDELNPVTAQATEAASAGGSPEEAALRASPQSDTAGHELANADELELDALPADSDDGFGAVLDEAKGAGHEEVSLEEEEHEESPHH